MVVPVINVGPKSLKPNNIGLGWDYLSIQPYATNQMLYFMFILISISIAKLLSILI